MKYLFIIISLLLFTIATYGQNKSDIYVSGIFDKLPIEQLMLDIANKQPANFFYKQEWLSDISISGTYDSILIDYIFSAVLSRQKYEVIYVHPNQFVWAPKGEIIQHLPTMIAGNQREQVIAVEKGKLKIEEQYLKGRKPVNLPMLAVGSNTKKQASKYVLINGRFEDKDSGEPIIGATMYIEELKAGAATDYTGWLKYSLKPGKYTAVFQCMGMADYKCRLDVRSTGDFNIYMEKAVTAIDEITVNADVDFKRGTKVGLEKVSLKSVKSLPTLMGEKDVLKISQMLPGIVSVSEGSSGVNVRGGNADQNLFYLNGIPIYNSSHLFGFFSAINSSIIKDFSIYKAYVPAQYGGRISSVFNVETRKGNKKELFIQGGISPISANLEVEAPIIKDKLSFMLSARSSYSNWILKRMSDPVIRNSDALFYDFSGALDYKIDDENRLDLFFNHSSDYFSLDQKTDYDYHNNGVVLNYMHRINQRMILNMSGVASSYSFNTVEKTNISDAYSHSYNIGHYEFNASSTYDINHKHELKFGASGVLYNLDRGVVNPYGTESNRSVVDLGIENGLESAIYINEKFTVTDNLTLMGGFRLSNFSEFGPKTVYSYQENAPREDQYIQDTLTYGNEIISNFTNPEFRLALDYKMRKYNSIKMSFTQMNQYLFMLSNTISLAPNDQWKMVDSHIKPPKSWQASMGYYQQILPWGLAVTTEVYYKIAENIVEYKDGADFLSAPNVETTLLQGNQDAYGLEFMLSKESGRYSGWTSYTYSRSIIQVDGMNEWDKINEGKPYASNYDKPHVLNVVANYQASRRVSFSSNIAYSTGRPVTYPESVFYVNGNPYVDYSDRNKYRIPDYFRIDASVTLEGNLKRKKPFHSFWMFSVYNLTGRKNANSIYFQTEKGKIEAYKYTLIGAPIFTVSWNFKLGNYNND